MHCSDRADSGLAAWRHDAGDRAVGQAAAAASAATVPVVAGDSWPSCVPACRCSCGRCAAMPRRARRAEHVGCETNSSACGPGPIVPTGLRLPGTAPASRPSPPGVPVGRLLDFAIDVALRADPLTADHAGHGHVHLAAGGHLLDRLHARRPGLLAVLHLHRRCSSSR